MLHQSFLWGGLLIMWHNATHWVVGGGEGGGVAGGVKNAWRQNIESRTADFQSGLLGHS